MKVHGEAFPHEPGVSVEALAQELRSVGVLRCYLSDGRRYVHLPGFASWQKPHRNEAASRCPAPPESVVHDNVGSGSGKCTEPLGETAPRILDPDPNSLDPVSNSSTAKKKKRSVVKLKVPTGNEALDYLLDEWADLLGNHGSLEKWVATSTEAYPGVDLLAEAKKARAWQLGKPANRKKKDVRSFLTGWWGRAQDRPGGSGYSGGAKAAESDDERLNRIFGGGA
tara:strand:- start:191 stop:865 length:675 start_codon:yes stop_codon:yes gene_type:complete